MIKNSNIAPGANIDSSKIAGGSGFSEIRETFYVCPTSSAAYLMLADRVPADKLYTTITLALAKAGNYDRIIVYPGSYDEGAVLNITQTGLEIIASGIDNVNLSEIVGSSATHHLMTINADNVLIQGMSFKQTKSTKDAVQVASTAAYSNIRIVGCRFDGNASGGGEYGVYAGGTYDSANLVVESCYFRAWDTVAIYAEATRGIYRRNTIFVPAAKIGIEIIPTTTARPGTLILDNYILGVNSTDTGIKITNTPNAGTYLIAKNMIVGTATTITQKPTNQYCSVENYTGSIAGGALIDTVA